MGRYVNRAIVILVGVSKIGSLLGVGAIVCGDLIDIDISTDQTFGLGEYGVKLDAQTCRAGETSIRLLSKARKSAGTRINNHTALFTLILLVFLTSTLG